MSAIALATVFAFAAGCGDGGGDEPAGAAAPPTQTRINNTLFKDSTGCPTWLRSGLREDNLAAASRATSGMRGSIWDAVVASGYEPQGDADAMDRVDEACIATGVNDVIWENLTAEEQLELERRHTIASALNQLAGDEGGAGTSQVAPQEPRAAVEEGEEALCADWLAYSPTQQRQYADSVAQQLREGTSGLVAGASTDDVIRVLSVCSEETRALSMLNILSDAYLQGRLG
ncbi:hypothetical protein [Miltoncostaea oceani]|uniref:hypothetical protein n=1 Tax=Miltoncostaea oceani TaxID=2843216 RepID=UPI001C3CEB70|nr:hypothetical protein [Miltoncostaea oceani]